MVNVQICRSENVGIHFGQHIRIQAFDFHAQFGPAFGKSPHIPGCRNIWRTDLETVECVFLGQLDRLRVGTQQRGQVPMEPHWIQQILLSHGMAMCHFRKTSCSPSIGAIVKVSSDRSEEEHVWIDQNNNGTVIVGMGKAELMLHPVSQPEWFVVVRKVIPINLCITGRKVRLESMRDGFHVVIVKVAHGESLFGRAPRSNSGDGTWLSNLFRMVEESVTLPVVIIGTIGRENDVVLCFIILDNFMLASQSITIGIQPFLEKIYGSNKHEQDSSSY